MKKLLCIISKPPFEGSVVMEQLEAAMVAAVFEMDVSVLFIDEGLRCLQAGQAGDRIGVRTPGKLIQGLEMYEIEHLYAGEEVASMNMAVPTNVLILTAAEQTELLSKQDIIIQ